jgi:hypothetical protein
MRKSKANVFQDIYNQPYNYNTRIKLYNSSKCECFLMLNIFILFIYSYIITLIFNIIASLQLIQRMSLLKKLKVHHGCVNSISWNNIGDLILSGSDDQHLVLTNAYNYQVINNNLLKLVLIFYIYLQRNIFILLNYITKIFLNTMFSKFMEINYNYSILPK